MAYEFTKLSEVPVANTVTDACNVLIEDGGEIKRAAQSKISASQVQADWNEDDETSPAFIMNKPTSLGGGKVTWFSICKDSNNNSIRTGDYWGSGTDATSDDVINAFENGVVRLDLYYQTCCGSYNGKSTLTQYTTEFLACGSAITKYTTLYYPYGRNSYGEITITERQ